MQLHVLADARWAAEGVAAVLQRAGAQVSVGELDVASAGIRADAVVALLPDSAAARQLLDRLPSSLPVLLLCHDLSACAALPVARSRSISLLPADVDDTRLQAAATAVALGLQVRSALAPAWPTSDLARAQAETLDPLTPRELEVLELMAKGLGNRDIAMALGISSHTAKFHVAQILDKTGAATRTEAVRQGLRLGLVGL